MSPLLIGLVAFGLGFTLGAYVLNLYRSHKLLEKKTTVESDYKSIVKNANRKNQQKLVQKKFKVFGIGLNKTGTTTLATCLQILGYRHKTCDLELLRQSSIGNLDPVMEAVGQYDSFEDWPFPILYKILDKNYPNSKFILTTRITPAIWIDSLKKHHTKHTGRFFDPLVFDSIVYGYPSSHGYEVEHVRFYNNFNEEVRNYFKGREKDFIELCWEKGDGWEKLCEFLSEDIPDIEFPHANKG